jgi:hypothetical protein
VGSDCVSSLNALIAALSKVLLLLYLRSLLRGRGGAKPYPLPFPESFGALGSQSSSDVVASRIIVATAAGLRFFTFFVLRDGVMGIAPLVAVARVTAAPPPVSSSGASVPWSEAPSQLKSSLVQLERILVN